MALTKLSSGVKYGGLSPVTVWQAGTFADVSIANQFYPDPGDLVKVASVGNVYICLPGGGFAQIGASLPIPASLIDHNGPTTAGGSGGTTTAALNTTGASL